MIEALDLDLTVRMTGGEVRLRVTDADLSALNRRQRATEGAWPEDFLR